MALIPCKSCKHEIAKSAKTCPNCGASIVSTASSVTTLIYFFLVGAFVFWIWGLLTPDAEAATGPEIAAHCQNEWPHERDMYEFCLSEQAEAKSRVMAGQKDVISAHCADEWNGDYEMQDFCEQEQRAAKSRVERHSGPLRTSCEREWGVQYDMVDFCIQEGG